MSGGENQIVHNCPSCGVGNPPNARFCNGCGNPIAGINPTSSNPQQINQQQIQQAQRMGQPVGVVEHIHHTVPNNRNQGMNACAKVGLIVVGICLAVVIISFVGCVGCATLFTTGANEVVKEMELAEDRADNPLKYTTKASGVEVVSAVVNSEAYGDKIKIVVKNETELTVNSVVVRVVTENEFGESNSFSDVTNAKVVEPEKPLAPGESRSAKFSHFGNKVIRSKVVTRVLFDDGSIWPDDYYIKSKE